MHRRFIAELASSYMKGWCLFMKRILINLCVRFAVYRVYITTRNKTRRAQILGQMALEAYRRSEESYERGDLHAWAVYMCWFIPLADYSAKAYAKLRK